MCTLWDVLLESCYSLQSCPLNSKPNFVNRNHSGNVAQLDLVCPSSLLFLLLALHLQLSPLAFSPLSLVRRCVGQRTHSSHRPRRAALQHIVLLFLQVCPASVYKTTRPWLNRRPPAPFSSLLAEHYLFPAMGLPTTQPSLWVSLTQPLDRSLHKHFIVFLLVVIFVFLLHFFEVLWHGVEGRIQIHL